MRVRKHGRARRDTRPQRSAAADWCFGVRGPIVADVAGFTVVLDPRPERGFTVSVPLLSEVVTEGDSAAGAMAITKHAICLVLA